MPKQFAAVEMLPGEALEHTVAIVMKQAHSQEIRFRTMEIFDIMSVQGLSFVRFRSDLHVAPLMGELLKTRCVIVSTGRGYEIIKPDGRRGPVSATTMASAPTPNHRKTFRGTYNKFWQRQFQFL